MHVLAVAGGGEGGPIPAAPGIEFIEDPRTYCFLQSDWMLAATTPLSDVVPWATDAPRFILVSDRLESDGRFALYTLASQCGNGLWLTSSTTALVAQGLKKVRAPSSWTIRQVLQELSQAAEEATLVESVFVEHLFQSIKDWCDSASGEARWIIVDDISTLAGLLGERLCYAFVLSLQGLCLAHDFGLVVRCAGDEMEEQPEWVGASSVISRTEQDVVWEHSLIELADGVVDVAPLTSGFSREVHGKLLFSAVPGNRGWGGRDTNHVFNYRLTDNQVLAIRVRGT